VTNATVNGRGGEGPVFSRSRYSYARIMDPITYVIGSVGSMANGFVMLALLCARDSRRKKINVFIINQTVLDLLACVFLIKTHHLSHSTLLFLWFCGCDVVLRELRFFRDHHRSQSTEPIHSSFCHCWSGSKTFSPVCFSYLLFMVSTIHCFLSIAVQRFPAKTLPSSSFAGYWTPALVSPSRTNSCRFLGRLKYLGLRIQEPPRLPVSYTHCCG